MALERQPPAKNKGKIRKEPRLFPTRGEAQEDGVSDAPPHAPATGAALGDIAPKATELSIEFPDFRARIRAFIVLAWLLPPGFSIFLLQYQGIYSASDMLLVLNRFGFAYIAICTLAASLLLTRFVERIAHTVADAVDPDTIDWRSVQARLKWFQRVLFASFATYCIVGPLIGDVVLDQARGKSFSVDEHIFALLATVPGVIITAIPIFFRLSDLIGAFFAERGGAFIFVSIGAKIAALGLLTPLMISTALFVYYRDRTGFVSTEAVAVCAVLLVAAGIGTYIAWNSFRHSLAPLRAPLRNICADDEPAAPQDSAATQLIPHSLDEIGLLVRGWAQLTEHDRTHYSRIRDKEEQIRMITDSLPALIAYVDSEERFQFVNQQYQEWWQVEPEELIGKSLSEFFPPELYRRKAPRIAAALAGVETSDLIEFLYPDGKKRTCEVRYVPHKSDTGAVLGYFALISDVTGQKQAEHAAQKAHQRLLDAIESLPAGFSLYDRDERLVITNSRYRELTAWHGDRVTPGLTFEELLRDTAARSGTETINKLDVASADSYVAQRLEDFRNATGKPFELTRKDGTASLSLFHKTSDGGTVSILLDITEQKQAEQAAQKNHQRLVDAIESLPTGFRIFDKDERLVHYKSLHMTENSWHGDFLKPGVTYEELLRNSVFNGISVHDMESDEAYYEMRLAQFRTPPTTPTEVRKSDGTTGLSIYRKMSDGGTVTILLDITEQKQAEQAAEMNHQRLVDAIESLPTGFRIFDRDGRLVLHNSQNKRENALYGDVLKPGVTFKELLRNSVFNGLSVHDMESDEAYFEMRLAQFQEPPNSPVEVRKSDGSTALSIYRKMSDGGTVTILLDITDQKHAETAASQADQRLKDAIESMPAGFRIFDADERLVLWNSRYEEQTRWHDGHIEAGITFKEILEKTVANRDWLDNLEGDDETHIQSRLAEFRNPGTPFEISRSDGGYFVHTYRRTADGGTVSVMHDITEQKEAENHARESHQRLHDAIESLPVGFRLFDAYERLVLCNSVQKDATDWHGDLLKPGITYEEILCDGVNKGMFLHDFPTNEEYIAHRLELFRGEYRGPVEGHFATGCHALTFYRKTSNGGTVAITMDVTERIEAEKRAQEANQRLLDAIECLPAGFCLFNKDEQVVITNSRQREATLWHGKTLRFGATFEDLIHSSIENKAYRDLDYDDPAAVEEFIAERIDAFRNPQRGSTELSRADGTTALHNIHKTSDGGTVSIMLDITELKQVEQALKASEARLNAILDLAPEAIVTMDENYHIQMFNAGAEQVFGYKARDVFGRNLDTLFAEGGHPEYPNTGEKSAEPAVSAWQMDGRREMIARHETGREFPVEISVAETVVDGARLHTVLLQDISERKRWEEEIRQAMHLADAANQAKSEFLSHMSHELRTPLNGILGYAEFIQDKWLGDDALDQYAEYAGFISESGQHLLQLINDILDLSKVEAGQYEFLPEEIEFGELFEECRLIVAADAENAGIAVDFSPQSGATHWTADRRALKQILINLLSNALKFSEAGARVEVWVARDGQGHYRLEVRDTGRGMTEEESRQALEPFVQVGTPYIAHRGTGLGLSLVIRLAALHGGTVEIRSKPGVGTTVQVTIPPLSGDTSTAAPPNQLSA